MKIEKYLGKTVSGHNCNFKYTDTELERHILFALRDDNTKVKITLEAEEGECYSGWTTATRARYTQEVINNFEGFTHVPKTHIEIDDYSDFPDDITNDVFTFSAYGGDSYYPSGSYSVNMNLFEQTIRHLEKRPVWIFYGKSNSGKSFLSHKLNNLTVYETDSDKNLPKELNEDIIVVGNKYSFSLDNIEKLLKNREVFKVKFS